MVFNHLKGTNIVPVFTIKNTKSIETKQEESEYLSEINNEEFESYDETKKDKENSDEIISVDAF